MNVKASPTAVKVLNERQVNDITAIDYWMVLDGNNLEYFFNFYRLF